MTERKNREEEYLRQGVRELGMDSTDLPSTAVLVSRRQHSESLTALI